MSHNSLTTLHGELSSLPNLRVMGTYTLQFKNMCPFIEICKHLSFIKLISQAYLGFLVCCAHV